MASTPSDLGRRLSPLLLIAVVEVLLVALAPSGSHPSSQAVGAPGSAGAVTQQGLSTTGGGAGSTAGVPGTTAGGTGGGGTAGGSGGSSGSAGASGGGSGGGGSQPLGYHSTDMSHCDRSGKQIGPAFYMPKCVPVWHGGNNGGATMTGVTAKQVRFVYFVAQSNAQVNAILNAEQLAATPEQFCGALQAWVKEVNKRFELYGRTLTSIDGPGKHSGSAEGGSCHFPFFQSQCTSTPPDQACYRAEADLIAKQLKPAFVLAPAADSTLSYQLARDHIVVFNGLYEPESYHEQLAPYLYEVSMVGDQVARMDAEYYCKKLAGKPVQYAGLEVRHPNGPTSKPPLRRLAVIYPENNGDATAKLSAQLIKQEVDRCSGGKGGSTLLFSYASDINSAQQQSSTTVAAIKKNHITDVACWCDPIAPVFLSNTLDNQNYHPEIYSLGMGLLDYDALAQLYNKNVWRYAFGPSLLGDTVPFAQTDAVKAWHDVGNSGEPDKTENLSWTFVEVMANAIQDAGPNLTPQSIHTGLVNAPSQGGDPVHFRIDYKSPWQWSAQKDMREVFWCGTQTSSLNGQPGTYVPVNGGRRYTEGQWTTSLSGVFPSGPCAP